MTFPEYERADPEPEPAQLPAHDFLLVPLIPLTEGEVRRFEDGQRVVFRKLDVTDRGQVRGSAIYCARCQVALERMGYGERDVCRGAVDDEAAEAS